MIYFFKIIKDTWCNERHFRYLYIYIWLKRSDLCLTPPCCGSKPELSNCFATWALRGQITDTVIINIDVIEAKCRKRGVIEPFSLVLHEQSGRNKKDQQFMQQMTSKQNIKEFYLNGAWLLGCLGSLHRPDFTVFIWKLKHMHSLWGEVWSITPSRNHATYGS